MTEQQEGKFRDNEKEDTKQAKQKEKTNNKVNICYFQELIFRKIINSVANNVTYIAIAWLIIGFILLIGYWASSCSVLNWQALDWQVITGFATWVLAGGVFLAFSQIREARRSTQAQIAMDLFRELRSDKTLEGLRFIYGLKPEKDHTNLTSIERHNVEYVLDRLDVLSVLVEKGFVDYTLAIDAYAGVPALRCWYILHNYIDKIRDKRKYFGDNFEAYTNRCMNYFAWEHIKVGFDSPYDTQENLVNKLRAAKNQSDEVKSKLYPRSLKEIKKQRKCESKS